MVLLKWLWSPLVSPGPTTKSNAQRKDSRLTFQNHTIVCPSSCGLKFDHYYLLNIVTWSVWRIYICSWDIWGEKVFILTAVDLKFGEYWRSLDTRSTASGGIRLWKIWAQEHGNEYNGVHAMHQCVLYVETRTMNLTLCQGWALICGNLNSV